MDYVLIGGVLLFGLIGLWKGGAKIFLGFFMLLVIMVGSAFISSALCPLFLQKKTDSGIEYTAPAKVLMTPLSSALPSDESYTAIFDTEIVLGEDGVLYVGTDGDVPLESVVSENVPYVGAYLGPVLNTVATPGTTLRTSIAYTVTRYIYEIVVWVVLVIILAIIRNIIRKKIFRWLDDKRHAVMSKIDRLIGFLVNVVIFVAIAWGVGLLGARFDNGSNWATSLNAFIMNGKIAAPFMQANPFLKLLGAGA